MTDDSNGPKGYFHTTEHQAQDINWGDLPRRVSDLGSGRGIWQVSVGVEKLHCVVLLVFFLGLFVCFSVFYYHHYFYLLLFWHFTLLSIIKPFLCQHRNFTSILLLISQDVGEERRGFSRWLCGVSSPARLKTTLEANNIPLHSRAVL